ncbi:sugar kinase [Flavobacterium psychrotrophum]|uniref:sugar kinase n=1 Tax=Flavobacterium psychrotrophum TaxID=2294119 RepID=UPI000E3162B5|nr:sugar kinase [Flavobacterium psychrotrophum]
MKNVLTFGELLIRLHAASGNFIAEEENPVVNVFPGGSEANVAVALSQLQIPVSYYTAIPDNAITQSIVAVLERNNIDTSKILFKDGRLGAYYLLSANGLTSGDVIYDRAYSSFSSVTVADIDWDTLFTGCSWFHWTALTPALSEPMAQLMKEALLQAEKRDLVISVDLNYRSRLWQYGKAPLEVMPELIKCCDVIMGNIWAANKMLGTSIDESLNRQTSKEDYVAFANNVAKEIFSLFPKCRHIANTFRFMDSPQHNLLYGTYHTPYGNHVSETLETDILIDRIGSGDAFMAGLISGIYKGDEPQKIIDTATATGFKKLFIKGDFLNIKQ